MINLNVCKPGDILITESGIILEYVCKTLWNDYTTLDHVVRYVKDPYGNNYADDIYSTRTNEGITGYSKNIKTRANLLDIIKIDRIFTKN